MEFHQYNRRRLRLLARACSGTTVLDLGYAKMPNPFLTEFHVTGLDRCRPSTPSGYDEELLGDATNISQSVTGRIFDNIVAGELIEHLERPYDFLRHLKPFLSEGGRLVLSTPNPLGFPVFIAEYTRNARYFYTRNHVYYFSPRWVVRMLEATGYEILQIQSVGLWNPWIVVPCPASVSYQVVYVARDGNSGPSFNLSNSNRHEKTCEYHDTTLRSS